MRPLVRTAKIYILEGKLTEEEVSAVKSYVINPVESREADLGTYDTLKMTPAIPATVETLDGFLELDEPGLDAFVKKYALAMDDSDIRFCQDYFKQEHRDPTITEIRMIDTYWSDHCRHTTFLTTIDHVKFNDNPDAEGTYEEYLENRKKINRTKPVNLMDLATFGTRFLKAEGDLPHLDESEEINACTVKIPVNVNGQEEKWLLLFKNETHNHPTEIEPFGGAATCIGGAIRDPLSSRAYVYAAMRVTGAGDPLKPISETIPGKLPQRKLVTTAANGYSSYGNQIGLATGEVDEIYHPGYVAKRMEIGAVIAAVPEDHVRREVPKPGDVVILLGGRTGRDGCGGATGSSKSHNLSSLETCGAEVQKGNAPIERKLQRLFRNKDATRLIKRCNDFGAGGVSVAIGELADGLLIDLNKVPKKYEGLDGTELAISESQERMAVVVAPEDVEKYIAYAESENLEATPVASVKEEKRLTMIWNGKKIVDLSREFLNSNGAEKHADAVVVKPEPFEVRDAVSFKNCMDACVSNLNVCSKRGLSERFDSTIGAGTVLMPFGGKYQLTPIQAMVHKISTQAGDTDDCSFMSYGFNPYLMEKSPYHGAYLSVIESLSKLTAAGADMQDVYLTFQEYFESMTQDKEKWGRPLSALLGALQAQMDYSVAAIGGKDSMSGTFENLTVPPTLVSFAVTTGKITDVVSPEFKGASHEVLFVWPDYDSHGLPQVSSEKNVFSYVHTLIGRGDVCAAYTLGCDGIAEAVFKMSIGNGIGFAYDEATLPEIVNEHYGSFLLELSDGIRADQASAFASEGVSISLLGHTIKETELIFGDEQVPLSHLTKEWEDKLEPIFICNNVKDQHPIHVSEVTYHADMPVVYTADKILSKPKVLIPVFPGTNCEYDSVKAWISAGADPETFVVNNLTKESIEESVQIFAKKVRTSQIIFLPGGFSGGDEPDGSGKFITAFFRNPELTNAVMDLLNKRDGLMAGICNGFQALIKLGLVPYGEIRESKEDDPTLTFNLIARHQSRLVRTRVCSNLSPWMRLVSTDEIYTVPVSHGEGRFVADQSWLDTLMKNGQIATQYVDLSGAPTMDIRFNPNGSAMAIEGISSPDGRVFGKMGHTERCVKGLYQNVPGNYDMKIFKSAVEYFKQS